MSQLLGKLSALLEQRLIRVTRLTELYLHLADYYGYQGLLQIMNALEGKDE